MSEIPQESVWLPVFLDFIGHLRINSKELDHPSPLKPNGAQMRYLAELCEGLERGVRQFMVLKARQLGMSTVCLAIDLFWLIMYEGTQGALVTDTEGNRDKFRIILSRYIQSLPGGLQPTIEQHNRNNLVLSNGSVLDYLVAGTKKKTDLGKSRALNFCHGTETSNWGDEKGVASLMASFAEEHPNRLYMFESTANGFNAWWKMYMAARADEDTQKAIFIGWWSKENYRLERGSVLFDKYFDGSYTDDELAKIAQVKEDYNFGVTAEQVAWYRWKAATRMNDEGGMAENFPWHESEAFVLSGQSFFPARRIQQLSVDLEESLPPFQARRYHFSERFDLTQFEAVETADEADLKIWEEPTARGIYAIGIDPAYGRSDYKDRHSIEVYRCYADRLVQVAEYATDVPETYQVAWALAHLAGCYRNCICNLEVTGPGRAIMDELRHLRQMFDAGMLPSIASSGKIQDIFGAVRWYLYHRPDSLSAGYIYNWNTTYDNKLVALSQMRDSLVLNQLEIRSLELADEMRTLVQDGGHIEASGTNKDDRVFGTALAHKAWVDWLRPVLVEANDTYERVRAQEDTDKLGPQGNVISGIVTAFFKDREEARERRLIEQSEA